MVRRTRKEIERLVVDAAVDLVQTEGLGTGLDGITYTRVFRHLEATTGQRVTRASVHERVWRDQAAFQSVVRDRIAAVDECVIDVHTLDEATDRAGIASNEQSDRLAALGAILRDASSMANRNEPSTLRQANLAIKALVALAEDDERSRAAKSVEAFRSAQQQRVEISTVSYGRTIRRLGGQLKSSLGIEFDEAVGLIVAAVDGLCEGLQLRAPFDDRGLDRTSVAMDGREESWPLTSIVGFSLITSFFDFPEAANG